MNFFWSTSPYSTSAKNSWYPNGRCISTNYGMEKQPTTDTYCQLWGILWAFLHPGFLMIFLMLKTFISIRKHNKNGLSRPCISTNFFVALEQNPRCIYMSHSLDVIRQNLCCLCILNLSKIWGASSLEWSIWCSFLHNWPWNFLLFLCSSLKLL